MACLFVFTAQAQQVYRWTDDQGVVHFSQQPPADGSSTEDISARKPITAKPVNEPTSLTLEEVLVLNPPLSPQEQLALTAEQMCEQSREQMLILDEHNKVAVTDGNGNKRLLSPIEREAEIALARGHIEIYCQSLKR